MNRQSLVAWSLDVGDNDFARALAAAGTLEQLHVQASPWLPGLAAGNSRASQNLVALLRDAAAADGYRLRWRLPEQVIKAVPSAAPLALLWPQVVDALSWPRQLRVLGEPSAALLDFSRVLSSTAVDVQGVSLEPFEAANGRVDWQLPFTLATLPGDPLAPALAAIEATRPPAWPYRFASAGRTVERPEMLVIGAGLADSLLQLLASGLRLKCCMVMVAGLGNEDLASAVPLLRALGARLRADGIAVLPVSGDAELFAQQLRSMADELTHNLPIDLALSSVFGRELLLFVNDQLLQLSQMTHAVDDITVRLRGLPPEADIALSKHAIDLLRFDQAMLKPIARPTARAKPPLPAPAEAARGPQPVGAAPAHELSRRFEAERNRYAYRNESDEASALTEVVAQVRAHEAAPAMQPRRYLQQQSFTRASGSDTPEQRGYVVGEPVVVQVRVAPDEKDPRWTRAPEAFPDEALPENRAVHPLRVMFHEPRQLDAPLLESLALPALGASTEARFIFTPREAGPFEARITVLHRNRVLQTALLRTTVAAQRETLAEAEGGLTLAIEVELRRDLADLGGRQRFDLAMVLNHTPMGQRRLTALSGRRAWASDLSGIDSVVDRINALISEVANSTRDYEGGLDKGKNPRLLARLARLGRNLYTVLDPRGDGALVSDGLDLRDDRITHIQVISTRMDDVVPIEFIYDYRAPDNERAKVCPKHRQALAQGACPEACPGRSKPAAHVCPMGFWGVRKVIERHAYNARLPNPDAARLVLQDEPATGRDRLDWRSGSVLGHSERVERATVDALAASLAGGLARKPVKIARNWNAWKALVHRHHPGLLIAFPHNSGENEDIQLEIGKAQLRTLDLDAAYVRDGEQAPPPVVFLLGCDIASTAEDFSSHVRYFRKAGAAVVVSTIATVFGAHAVKVGEQIVHALLAPRDGSNERLGEVLREAKRQALLASVPMALCVVAFGDADWRL